MHDYQGWEAHPGDFEQPVNPAQQESLRFSQQGPQWEADVKKTDDILSGRKAFTVSSQRHLDLFLDNYTATKEKVSILIQQYLDDPIIVMDLISINDRMDATLRRYRELVESDRLPKPVVDDPAVEGTPADVGDSSDEDAAVARYMAAQMALQEEWHNFEPFECDICLDDVESKERIQEGQVLDIDCMHADCEEYYEYNDVKAVVPAETFYKYEEFTFLAALNADPSTIFCPNPAACGNAIVIDQEDPGELKVVCRECKYEFCRECMDEAHIGTCEDYEQWKIDNGKANQLDKRWERRNTKKCPNCKAATQKNSGCNHMTCYACKYEWCWLCGRKYTSRHFDVYNVLGCPGLQSGSTENFGVGRRMGVRLLIGLGIGLGAIVGAAVLVPAAVVGGPIYGGYKLNEYRKRKKRDRLRRRRYGR